jgi:acyl transferase domain-containing protein
MHNTDDNHSPLNAIAIVGMAGRFPKAQDLEAFWKNLAAGLDAISYFSHEELVAAGVPAALLRRPNYVPAKHVLEDADLFDSGFFGYSSSEARLIDPQQRVFLEICWHALEDAGYVPEHFPGAIGVFAGCSTESYLWRNVFANAEVREQVNIIQKFVNNFRDFLATRVSYKLGLTGPGLTIQTACSSSLVAVHTACQSLLSFECDMALAGGISITMPRKSGYLYVEGGIGSPDAKCRAFDQMAQGCTAGNGGGAVLLRRLADAIRDRDSIRAIILGSAINNDGSDKAGFTAPSVRGQAEAIAMAHSAAGISPESITYVEAHGTGTGLGDPIEVDALTRAFRIHTAKRQFCALSALKTNIGHLDAAAGIAGLIKTVLALEHKQIPAVLHYETPNPKIAFEQSPFYVNAKLADWSSPEGQPRRTGVSSFGMGGTNSHAVLEEAPAGIVRNGNRASHSSQILVLSANSASALGRMRSRLAEHLDSHPELSLADSTFTLQVGRRTWPHRFTAVVRSREEAIGLLRVGNPPDVIERLERATDRAVVFDFPEVLLSVRQPLVQCPERFRATANASWLAIRAGVPGLPSEPTLVDHAGLQEFFAAYCLAKLYMELGVKPAACVGQGLVGGHLARCLAGEATISESARAILQVSAPLPMPPLAEFEEEPVTLNFGDENAGPVWTRIARLWAEGAAIDWTALHAGHERCRISLPGYCFERERHWVDPDTVADQGKSREPESEPAVLRASESGPALHIFEEQLTVMSRQLQLMRSAMIPGSSR